MSYIKSTWTSSTVTTTEILNHIETQYSEAKTFADAHNHDDRYYTKSIMDGWFWCKDNDGPGSGCDADAIYHANGPMHYSSFSGSATSGIIIMWDNSTPPAGWNICDGTNGTVDLRDYFVIGACNAFPEGSTGGAHTVSPTYALEVAQHALTTEQIPGHTHQYTDYAPPLDGSVGYYSGSMVQGTVQHNGRTTDNAGNGEAHTHYGSSATQGTTENRPPFKRLYYIQKL